MMSLSTSRVSILLLSLILILTGCSNEKYVEYWVPDSEIPEYFIMLQGGAIRLGGEFKDESNQFEVLSEKDGEIHYKQPLGMFDFVTKNGRVVEITTASNDVILASKFYLGMSQRDILGRVDSPIITQLKDRTIIVDDTRDVAVEAVFDKASGKSTVIRISCLRMKD